MLLKVIGGTLVLIAALFAMRRFAELKTAILTDGEVSELIPKEGSEGTTYGLKVSFRSKDGHIHYVASSSSQSPQFYKVGDKIRVFYKEADPAKAGLASFGHAFFFPWLLFIIGVCLLGFPLGNALLENFFPNN